MYIGVLYYYVGFKVCRRNCKVIEGDVSVECHMIGFPFLCLRFKGDVILGAA